MAVVYLVLSIVLIILLTARYKMHPVIMLFLVALFYGICVGMPFDEIITSVNEGFGNTLGGILDADIGLVMLLGVPISAIALFVGLIYANKYVARTYIDPIPEVDEQDMKERLRKAPGAMKSSLPVFVPIILIVLQSVISMFEVSTGNFFKKS